MLPSPTLPASWRSVLETFYPVFARAGTFTRFTILATGLVARTSRRTVVGMLAGAQLGAVVSFHAACRCFSAAVWNADRLGLVLAHRWARAFWQVFVPMAGLWMLTNTTVLLLTDRLATDSSLDSTAIPVVMGIASVAQAVVMALAGHLSTRVGRRRVFVLWGVAAGLAGPLVWWLAVHSPTFAAAAACAAVLQVITVSAYGPVSAYLSERFPTEVSSTGYGPGYSLPLIIPALYPFYLPALEAGLGRHGFVMALVALGGALLVLGAALGPKLAPRDLDGDLDEVAAGAVRAEAARTESGE